VGKSVEIYFSAQHSEVNKVFISVEFCKQFIVFKMETNKIQPTEINQNNVSTTLFI
jgi:hypothetical protein